MAEKVKKEYKMSKLKVKNINLLKEYLKKLKQYDINNSNINKRNIH